MANKGIHTDHIENTVKHLSDGVVDLSTEPFGSEDCARKMRVLKMPGAFTDMKVYAYRVGAAGIEMAALPRVGSEAADGRSCFGVRRSIRAGGECGLSRG